MNTAEESATERSDLAPRSVFVLVSLALAALTWAVFGQTLGHGFVAYDDQTYVYQNPRITSGITLEGLSSAFTRAHARNWHPLTTISHMLDCQLFGLNPAGHHLINVLLHTAAVLLLFSVLRAMTGALWRSAFVAAVFAIHPLRAESVAWIAERKDVLSGLFVMLTLAAYVHYVRRPSVKRYLLIIAVFVCGLMSKPMLVTLPFLLLLLDYWPLNRFDRDVSTTRFLSSRLVLEKVPLLLLSVGSSAATLFAQRSTISYGSQIPFAIRLANALISYVVYVGQLIWPAKLAVVYPYAGETSSGFEIALAFVFVVGITLLVLAMRRRLPCLTVGWCWYLISLVPVIGLVQVGLQGHADRYTYLPQIGLCIAITWAAADLFNSLFKRRAPLITFAALVIALLAWRGWIQTSSWKNTESLWAQAVAVAPNNDVAQFNTAEYLLARGRVDDAIAHYKKALSANPAGSQVRYHLNPAIIHTSIGNAFARKGLFEQALVQYRQAIASNHNFADAHSNLAAMLVRCGDVAGAIAEYEIAVEIPPKDAASHRRLAALLEQTGSHDLAVAHYRRAAEISPDPSDAPKQER
ncbi:MAG TPA: tetratricopeptide repeat protein [Chthoniobacterales bacterium]|nr:tetratricopeptide repeat protein [Chthoniobacterales bacterium]